MPKGPSSEKYGSRVVNGTWVDLKPIPMRTQNETDSLNRAKSLSSTSRFEYVI